MNDPINTEANSLLELVDDWRDALTRGAVRLEVTLLGLIAVKAAELSEMVSDTPPDGTSVNPAEVLAPFDQFADVIDQWGDTVPEGWL